MLPDKSVGCHRTGFAKSCRDCVIEHNCRLWQQIIGTDPNTGQEINAWGCADEFRNKLLIENAQQSRQTGAAVESFRNEMSSQNASFYDSLVRTSATKPRQVEVVDVAHEALPGE